MTDETKWRALAHCMKADDAYVLVIDEIGGVRWQGKLRETQWVPLWQQVQHVLMK